MIALDDYLLTRAAHVPRKLYAALNTVDMTTVPCLTREEKLQLRESPLRTPTHRAAPHTQIHTPAGLHIVNVPYGGIELTLALPLDVFAGEVGEYSVTTLLATFGAARESGWPHALTALIDAIVLHKRVLFLSNSRAVAAVRHVVAAAALARGDSVSHAHHSPPIYPYVTLASADSLSCTSAYIAGTTNARLAELDVWDVLGNVDTGAVHIRPGTHQSMPMSAMREQQNADTLYLAGVLMSIESHASEAYVRAWMNTFLRTKQRNMAPDSALDRLAALAHDHVRVQDAQGVARLFGDLSAYAASDIDAVRARIDGAMLTTLSHGLYHPDRSVCHAAAHILECLASVPDSPIRSLNRFQRLALLHVIGSAADAHVSICSTDSE